MRIIREKKNKQKQIIEKAVEVLAAGGFIIYPTETCYGLGADATNPNAVDKVFAFKGNRRQKPISVAVANEKMAAKYVIINQTAKNIYRHLLPGPITVVSQSRKKVDSRLEAESGTLGIRIPDYPLILKLIATFGKPITSTSANISGGKVPYSISDVLARLPKRKKELIDLIIDAGKLPYRPPSSVIDTTLNEPTLLRQGEVDFNQLGAKSIISYSVEETKQLAQKLLSKNLSLLKKKALLFALQGELGAGKTQFAQGLGEGLKIKQSISSPTFIIVKEYPYQLKKTRGVFYHIDAWRLAKTNQRLNFIKKYLQPGNIIALEWMQKGRKTLEELTKNRRVKVVWLEIIHRGEKKREIRLAD